MISSGFFNLNCAVTAPNNLSRMPVCQFSMNFPLFKAGNRTGIARSVFGTAPSPACPPFLRFQNENGEQL
jgi:hypothetical protein